MKEKKYKTIKEVSELLNINSHVIRYWDSKFDGLSTRLHANKQRFFNDKNIIKLKGLKDTLYQDGKHNYSLDLASKILNDSYNLQDIKKNKFEGGMEHSSKLQKINIKELNIVRKNLFSLLDE